LPDGTLFITDQGSGGHIFSQNLNLLTAAKVVNRHTA
jgi:hypothetical protein